MQLSFSTTLRGLTPDTHAGSLSIMMDWVNIQCLYCHVEVNIVHIIHSREKSDNITIFPFIQTSVLFQLTVASFFFFYCFVHAVILSFPVIITKHPHSYPHRDKSLFNTFKYVICKFMLLKEIPPHKSHPGSNLF